MKFTFYIFLFIFITLSPVLAGASNTVYNIGDEKNEKVVDEKQISASFYIANCGNFYAVKGTVSTQTEIIFEKNSTIDTKNRIAHTIMVYEQTVNINQLSPIRKQGSVHSRTQLVISKKHKAIKKTFIHKPETTITSLPLNRPYNSTKILSMANEIAVVSNTNFQKSIKKASIGIIVKNYLYSYNSKLIATTSLGIAYTNDSSNFDITYVLLSRPPPEV